jgi:hypothetical protein
MRKNFTAEQMLYTVRQAMWVLSLIAFSHRSAAVRNGGQSRGL